MVRAHPPVPFPLALAGRVAKVRPIGEGSRNGPASARRFSKKLENLQAAVALYFAHYNLLRVDKTLRVSPAMAADVTDRLWSLEELVDQTSK